MKTTFLVFIMLLIGLTTTSSCKKKHCWDCDMYRHYTSTPNAVVDPDSSFKACDYTNDEIDKFEDGLRYDSAFINAQGHPDTLLRQISCDKVKKNLIERLTPNFSWN